MFIKLYLRNHKSLYFGGASKRAAEEVSVIVRRKYENDT